MLKLVHDIADTDEPGLSDSQPSRVETLALLKAFMKIKDEAMKKMIVELVERLGNKTE